MRIIIAALAAANLVFALLARKAGHSPRALAALWLQGLRQAFTVACFMLVIGIVTGIWRASGTIAGAVYYGVQVITPHLFLPVAFLLTSLLSYALGTSFGIVATAGVIFMTLARSGGVDAEVTAGLLFSAIMVGDRGSPVSSSAITVAHLTGTDLYGNVRRMLRSGALPFALCCLLCAVMAFRHPIREVDPAVIARLETEFSFPLWIFVPAVLMLLLPLLRLPILHCMGLSILSGLLAAHYVQGMTIPELLRCCLLGYSARDAELASILNGGGMVSMLDTCAVVLLACGCSGLFGGTTLVNSLQRGLDRLASHLGLFPTLMLCCLGASSLFCNQIIAIVMGSKLLGPLYDSRGIRREQLALDIENTAITLPALIPWCILSSVPLKLMGVGYSCLRYAVFLYAVPLLSLIGALLREHRASCRGSGPSLP